MDNIDQIPIESDQSFQTPVTSADASSGITVQAAVTGKHIYITQLVISAAAAMSLTFQDDTGTPIKHLGPLYMPANSIATIFLRRPIRVAKSKAFKVVASTSGNISVTPFGYYAGYVAS